ncbi:MAG: DUF885 family protein [Candidatus Xenobiia bacterium LiM19]
MDSRFNRRFENDWNLSMKSLSRLFLLILTFIFLGTSAHGADRDRAALELFDTFTAHYKALRIPDLSISYEENFRNIPSLKDIAERQQFFILMRKKLGRIERKALSDEVRYLYDGLLYEIDFNLERLRLEKQFRTAPSAVTRDGLYNLPQGKEWYRLYVRRWASKKMTPEEVRSLGQRDVARVMGEIEAIQQELGFAGRSTDFHRHLSEPSFFIKDRKELQLTLQKLRDTVFSNLGNNFEMTDISRVDIRPIRDANKDTPPGYYQDGVFYYSFYSGRFLRRSMEWLFIHEAVPGHHYQMEITRLSGNRPAVRALFWYPGFSEGWAAYAEDLGKDMGCYRDPYLYLGKWEWDLVRSARLVMDVGIHYEGWTRAQALRWWNENVPSQADIFEREVDRVTRWPAQAVSYKAGEDEIVNLRKMASEKQGSDFDLRRFHTLVVQRGSIPLPLLREIVLESQKMK